MTDYAAIELVQDGAELMPAEKADLSGRRLRLGIDVGSTTVKLAVIDEDANERGSGERIITAPGSAIEAHVIPANEEFMVVNETYRLCKSNAD